MLKENGEDKMVRENNINQGVLERIAEKTILVNNILCKKSNWIGTILRRNCFLQDALEGQMTE